MHSILQCIIRRVKWCESYRYNMWSKQPRKSVSTVRHVSHLQSCANFDSIDKINKILVGERQYSSIPANALKELDAFCKEFLSCTCCEDNEVATKLAELSLFLCFRHHPGYSGSDDDLGLLREQFSDLCANPDPRLIIPATPIDFRFLSRQSDESALYIRIPNVNLGKYTDDDPWWRGEKGEYGYSLEFQVRFEPAKLKSYWGRLRAVDTRKSRLV